MVLITVRADTIPCFSLSESNTNSTNTSMISSNLKPSLCCLFMEQEMMGSGAFVTKAFT